MGKTREFDNILDECLDRAMQGQDIGTILALYPEHAAELEPLLKTALDTRKAATIKPRPEFRQRAGYEFQAAIRDIPPRKARNSFRWQVGWMAPVALVLVLVLGGGGTVMAASNSLPDSPLYKVKLATEAVQLAFASSDMAKAELYARFADERVEEIVKLAAKGNTEQVEKVTERMNNQLIAMANLTATGEESMAMMSSSALQAPAATSMPVAKATVTPSTTTPAITTVPSTTQPSINGAPPPATDTTPSPVISPPETDTLRSQSHSDAAGSENGHNNKNITQKNDRNEKLKNNLVKKNSENLKALEDELEKAPEPLKSAIQRAIDILLNGYETNISNLAD